MKTTASKLASTIKRIREKSGMTPAQLAAASSLKVSEINAFESGKTEPLFTQIMLIASALNKPLSAFDTRPKATGSAEEIERREQFFDRVCAKLKCTTQTELATALGYHQSDISSMKNGRYTPGPVKLEALAERTGLPLRTVQKAFAKTKPA